MAAITARIITPNVLFTYLHIHVLLVPEPPPGLSMSHHAQSVITSAVLPCAISIAPGDHSRAGQGPLRSLQFQDCETVNFAKVRFQLQAPSLQHSVPHIF